MDKRVLTFLKRHRISVLTTLLKGGKPHSASMHYATAAEPLRFIPLRENHGHKGVDESEEISLRRDSAPDEALGEDTPSVSLGSFIFLTEKGTRKLEGLGSDFSSASLVIGFSTEEWLEFQAEGEIKILADKAEIDWAWDIYSEKFVGMDNHRYNSGSVTLLFKVIWWRYTDFRSDPPLITSSEDKNGQR